MYVLVPVLTSRRLDLEAHLYSSSSSSTRIDSEEPRLGSMRLARTDAACMCASSPQQPDAHLIEDIYVCLPPAEQKEHKTGENLILHE